MNKLRRVLNFVNNVNIIEYCRLNFFCTSVIRKDSSRIIPFRNAVLDLAPSSKIIISGGNMEIGCSQLKGSKCQTFVRLRENAVWKAYGGCSFAYGTTVEILKDAAITSGFFTMNTGSTMIAAKAVDIGQDVMIARDVVIYDSDFHPVVDQHHRQINNPETVRIGKHVWIGTRAIILKGVRIGDNSIIAAGSIVRDQVKENVIYNNMKEQVDLGESCCWERS